MVEVGDVAPDFDLVGVTDGIKNSYCLSEATDAGYYLLLVFYPADFSPVCTAEMCAIRDSEFFLFTENVKVWGISGDSVYAHQAFEEEFGLNFPLLADTDNSVAARYSTRYDEWEGQREITKRAVFVVDPERRIRYAWGTDDAYVEPDLWPVKEALDAAIDQGLDPDKGTASLAEPYQDTGDDSSE
jgi:peroxiredoxin